MYYFAAFWQNMKYISRKHWRENAPASAVDVLKSTNHAIHQMDSNCSLCCVRMYMCPPYLYTVATLPWEIQKSHFQQYYSYILQIIYVISEKNKLLSPYLPRLKNVTTLPCKM